MSGILAERSYGYLEIGEPKQTLAMRDEVTAQIDVTHNSWLHAWIPLDWARAYLQLGEIGESVREGRKFYQRTLVLESPHAISWARNHLTQLEAAGYATVKAVREFHEELHEHTR